MNLNEEQEYAFELLKLRKNVFITGPGGTGKTTLINKFRQYCVLNDIRIAMTSTTGVSALLINGTTIHSFGGIKTGDVTIKDVLKNKFAVNNWRYIQVLVIDEMSMLKPEIFELLDGIAKKVRNNISPFGGIQVIGTGDFAQLPPIYEDRKDSKDSKDQRFCFESDIFGLVFPRENIVYLRRIMRQLDKEFQEMLNLIRLGEYNEDHLKMLEARKVEPKIVNGIIPTMLYSLRRDVEAINNRELSKLVKNETHVYKSRFRIMSNDIEKNGIISDAQKELLRNRINNACPAMDNLVLPLGAQVMVIYNINLEEQIVNGTRGVVIGFAENEMRSPVIRLLDKREITVEQVSWEYKEYKSSISIIKTQIPLIPAYALTIHKCQGATLDMAIIDAGDSIFEYGQLYTALSRVRSLDNLYLVNFSEKGIMCNPKVKSFYGNL
jgi:ATP-dependent DNA helicase PIF1